MGVISKSTKKIIKEIMDMEFFVKYAMKNQAWYLREPQKYSSEGDAKEMVHLQVYNWIYFWYVSK